mgnify:CR=1 FL=1
MWELALEKLSLNTQDNNKSKRESLKSKNTFAIQLLKLL